MRIVEIISGLGQGGAERALATRLQFAPHDIETHVVVTGKQDSNLGSQIRENAAIYREPSQLTRLVKGLCPDLILTHNPREALRVLAHSHLVGNYPVVAVAHNEITSEYKAKAVILDSLLPRINPRAQMHIAVSTRASLGPQCANGKDVRICLLGGEFDAACSPDSSYWPIGTVHRVLVLGRFSPQKNLKSLLKAVTLVQDSLRESQTHLVLAGSGELRNKLVNEVTRKGVQDLISFPGWIDRTNSLMAGADTLLVTSTREGGPLTLYEALLAGIRVVSTPAGAATDVLRNDNFLRVLPDATAASLSIALRTIAHDPILTWSEIERRRVKNQIYGSHIRSKVFYGLCRHAAT